MPRLPSSPSLVALFVALLWGCAHQAHGQMTDGALSPAGRLSIEVLPSFQMWDHRFGVHDEGGLSVTGSEPLGFDLENEPILPIRDLEQSLRAALADPSLTLVLGSARALVSRERTRISFGLALGVFDWLTIGAGGGESGHESPTARRRAGHRLSGNPRCQPQRASGARQPAVSRRNRVRRAHRPARQVRHLRG